MKLLPRGGRVFRFRGGGGRRLRGQLAASRLAGLFQHRFPGGFFQGNSRRLLRLGLRGLSWGGFRGRLAGLGRAHRPGLRMGRPASLDAGEDRQADDDA
ncbi:MAG: hypothetical protein VYB34_09205 [Planctomycetota bacterium]|nr:hypothetical protein [Planctomycetota bacterium]